MDVEVAQLARRLRQRGCEPDVIALEEAGDAPRLPLQRLQIEDVV